MNHPLDWHRAIAKRDEVTVLRFGLRRPKFLLPGFLFKVDAVFVGTGIQVAGHSRCTVNSYGVDNVDTPGYLTDITAFDDTPGLALLRIVYNTRADETRRRWNALKPASAPRDGIDR